MINFNGALIHRPHRAWSATRSQTIQRQQALALTDLIPDYAIKLMVAEGPGFTLPNRPYQNVPFLTDMPHPPALFDAEGLKQAPISVTAFVQASQLPALQTGLQQRFPTLTGRLWGAWSGTDTALEIVNGEISKSQAIRYLLNYYHKTTADVWAFGDEENDLDMLSLAGHAVAMQNATPAVKQVADRVTKFDNDHDGLANFLTKVFLNEN